jgi:hypothetical protein
MKTIINGTRYDTSNATLIGETSNNNAYSVTDFAYWSAGLYVTPRSKRYFIAGEGGAMSRFAKPYGRGGSIGGEGIIPMSEADAFEWAQQELSSGEVEEFFGHLIEDA